MARIPKKYREEYEKNLVVAKKKKTGELVYGPKGEYAKKVAETEGKLKGAKRPKLTPYIKKHLAAKIKKVKKDNPSLSNQQALGKAIGILRTEEKKKS